MAFGIDFGTTNSAIAFDQNTLIGEGDQPFPSIIAVDPATGEIKSGLEARHHRERLQAHDWVVISSVKRQLGQDRHLATINGQSWTSTRIAEELFRALKKRAEEYLRGQAQMEQAVLSVPIGFRAEPRRRLREAAKRAGITITDFVAEPTAAFLKCREEMPEVHRVAVFDWGGGTLDVSILQIDGSEVRELATAGLEKAGDLIDNEIAKWAHEQMVGSSIDFAQVPPRDRDQLRSYAEDAKRSLTDHPTADIVLLRYLDRSGPKVTLDRPTLDRLSRPFVDEAIAVLRRAVGEADATGGEVQLDRILLVGGTSKLATLRPRLEEAFGPIAFEPGRPQWATAQGASILADRRDDARYKLLHPVYLVQSDGTPLPLVNAGDAFDDRYHRHHVAVVEESTHAQLVFAVPGDAGTGLLDGGDALRHIGYRVVPLQGFFGERVRVEAQLTHDLTLHIRAQSENSVAHNDGHWTSWEYGKLRFAYQLPRPKWKLATPAVQGKLYDR